MNYFREYAVNIVIVSILATLLENILPPGKHKKYISVVISLVVMMVIMRPLSAISSFRGELLSIPYFEAYTQEETGKKNLVASQFEKNLGEKIKNTVKEELRKEISAKVVVELNENGEITGIKSVSVSPLDEEIRSFIQNKFDIAPEIITQ